MKLTTSLIFKLIFAALFIVFPSSALQVPTSKSWFNIYGFGRTNFAWDNQDMGRSDLFVPANIKVGQPRNPNFFIGAKQTRIGFDFHQPIGDNDLFIKLEEDFQIEGNNARYVQGLYGRCVLTK